MIHVLFGKKKNEKDNTLKCSLRILSLLLIFSRMYTVEVGNREDEQS